VESWPISKLKRSLLELGEDLKGVTEKEELVSRMKDRLRKQAAVPAGFVYDPHSSYYFSHERQLYFDAASGFFYDGKDWIKDLPK